MFVSFLSLHLQALTKWTIHLDNIKEGQDGKSVPDARLEPATRGGSRVFSEGSIKLCLCEYRNMKDEKDC